MATVSLGVEQEYLAAKRGIALADRSDLGRIEMTGADALDLLHRLSTQDLKPLSAGQGAGTVLTTEKGRIIDFLAVLHFGSRLVLVTSPSNQAPVLAWFDRYTFSEDSSARDITGSTGLLAFFGPRAPDLAARLAGRPLDSLPLFHHTPVEAAGVSADLFRAREPGGGFQLLLPGPALVPSVRDALAGMAGGVVLPDAPVRAVGPAAYEMLRVEAALPAFGKEIGEQYNPLEAGLAPYVSFTKGCYIGQEVVARLDAYDKVQKRLVVLLLPEGEVPSAGTSLFAEGKEAGFVTSATLPPAAVRPVGLGYVRAAYATPGKTLAVETARGPASVQVASLS